MLLGHMGIIMRMSAEPFATLTGKVARITELDEVMQELEEEMRRLENNQPATAAVDASDADADGSGIVHTQQGSRTESGQYICIHHN